MISTTLIIIIILLLAAPVVLLFLPRYSAGVMTPTHTRGVRNLIKENEGNTQTLGEGKKPRKIKDILRSKKSEAANQTAYAGLTLAKKLVYAQWPITPWMFIGIEILLTLLIIAVTWNTFGVILRVAVIFVGSIILRGSLTAAVERRAARFDKDYSQFLLSIMSLLKTGMSSLNAIESSAAGLDPKSLVRQEVLLMVERMRMGMPEDQSIGAFGETIHHAEIELFIQALLLSKRMGGALSDTLDRLSTQVRKRQYFRNSANAAVALQRSSAWFILILLVLLEGYIYYVYPSLIVDGLFDPTGWLVWQSAIVTVAVAILWSRAVTNIKI